MYPKTLLLAALTAVTVVQATWLENHRIPYHDKRQLPGISLSASVGDGDGGSQTAAETTTAPPTSTPTAPPTSSTPPPPPTSTSSTPAPPSSSTTSVPRTTSSPSTSSTSTPSPETITQVTVITTTNSDGSPTSFTSATTATTTPGLSQENSSTSSMSPQTRNIVIGVVVGVGGAIILAALGILAWRIWGRKKPVDDNDGLVSYGPGSSYGGEGKSEVGSSTGGTVSGRTPFQSTLESYHAPTQVNPSANF